MQSEPPSIIYSKSDISDVSNDVIEEAIAKYEEEIQQADNSY